MPEEEIKRINDPDQLRQIAERVFSRHPVQLQDKTGLYPVNVSQVQNGILTLLHNQPDARARLLVINHHENKMFLECLVLDKDQNGNERVKPVRLHLKRLTRRQQRVQLKGRDNKVAWITEVIPMKSIPEFLSAYNRTRDMLTNAYQEQLRLFYTEADIVFRKTFRMDVRMRSMTNLNRPIFVPTRLNPNSIDATRFIPYEEYRKIIQYDHLAETIIGEITRPLSFKDIYLFGYIKVTSDRELTMDDYDKVTEISEDYQREIINQELLPRNMEKSVVADITANGIGFLHPHNPSVIRNFMPGEHIVFDIHFPGSEVLTVSGIIRNIKSLEKAHRIGVEFENLNVEQKAKLITYIDSIHNPTGTKDEEQ